MEALATIQAEMEERLREVGWTTLPACMTVSGYCNIPASDRLATLMHNLLTSAQAEAKRQEKLQLEVSV